MHLPYSFTYWQVPPMDLIDAPTAGFTGEVERHIGLAYPYIVTLPSGTAHATTVEQNNQLMWEAREGEIPRLLYQNREGEVFALHFERL